MTEATRIQIENMKSQTYGVEVEMNNITRWNAAKTAATFFGTGRYEDTHRSNGYESWSAWDAQGREWKFQKDVSIAGPDSEKCELVTPVLTYEDMELLQGLIRELRHAKAQSSPSRGCGVHIHIGSDGHTPQTILNRFLEFSLAMLLLLSKWNTGLRAVDICAIRLGDIDWEHNSIHIIQQKTGRSHDIPLTEAIGNALADYLLNERPESDSDFVFLRSQAPFAPLMSHAGIRSILFNVVNDSDIDVNGRIYGTRITRHSAASRMLRKGIPLPVISEMLGHGNKDSVMIYITTDEAKLAECTLPLPKGGGVHG